MTEIRTYQQEFDHGYETGYGQGEIAGHNHLVRIHHEEKHRKQVMRHLVWAGYFAMLGAYMPLQVVIMSGTIDLTLRVLAFVMATVASMSLWFMKNELDRVRICSHCAHMTLREALNWSVTTPEDRERARELQTMWHELPTNRVGF